MARVSVFITTVSLIQCVLIGKESDGEFKVSDIVDVGFHHSGQCIHVSSFIAGWMNDVSEC